MCHAVSYVAADGETLPNNFSIPVQIYYDTIKRHNRALTSDDIRNAVIYASGENEVTRSALNPIVDFEINVLDQGYDDSEKARLMYNVCMLQCGHVIGKIAKSNIHQLGPAAKVIITCSIYVHRRLGNMIEVEHLQKSLQEIKNVEQAFEEALV